MPLHSLFIDFNSYFASVEQQDLYVEYHEHIVEILETCIHVEEVHSIDEMRCELTGKLKERERAVALAKTIKETLRKELGTHMRNSIGLAPNPFLAKTATDMEKPDISPGDFPFPWTTCMPPAGRTRFVSPARRTRSNSPPP